MSIVIDVDSHWTFSWEFSFKEGPLKDYASRMPDEAGMLSLFLLENLTRSLPASERPEANAIFPPVERPNGWVTQIPEHWDASRQAQNAPDRIAWMNQVGIDYSIVNSGGFPVAFVLLEDVEERQEYCRRSNDILFDALDGYTDRLGGVTYADLTDLDWAIAEIGRMHARGSRAFSIRAEPVNGMSLGHPHFDRLWSALVDHGMIVSVHIGLTPAIFGDWGRLGLDVTKPADRGAFMRMSNSHNYQAAELFLSAMLFGGVFRRHPKLTVLIAELGIGWFPHFLRRMEGLTHPSGQVVMGEWPGDLSGGDYLRRQVRVSPLIGLGDINAIDVLRALPEMIVFSSDYPHTEGNADPIALYGEELIELDPTLRRAFMGETMAQDFERMGDPLAVFA